MTVICSRCSEKRANNDCIARENDTFTCYFCLRYYQNKNGIKDSKQLKKCDVYRLVMNEWNDYAFVEWGRAKEMGKMLVLVLDNNPNIGVKNDYQKTARYLRKDSIRSFKNIPDNIKDIVITKKM